MRQPLTAAMPNPARKGKCAHCDHPWGKHTANNVNGCAQRMPVAWQGQGKSKRPIMGYCPCPGYEPKGE